VAHAVVPLRQNVKPLCQQGICRINEVLHLIRPVEIFGRHRQTQVRSVLSRLRQGRFRGGDDPPISPSATATPQSDRSSTPADASRLMRSASAAARRDTALFHGYARGAAERITGSRN